jgi:hypothetical protein
MNLRPVHTNHKKDPNGPPTKPDLKIVRTNMDGTFFTWKLAVHYFRKQPDTEDRDRCFIITGSMVAYIDSPVHCFLRKKSGYGRDER